MSLPDNASESSLSDVLEPNANIPVPASTYIPSAMATPNTDCLPTPPYSSSHLHKLSMPGDLATKVSERHRIHRHTRTSARYSAYSLPSLGQRQVFKRRSPKKEMFIEVPHLPSVPPVEPTTVSPTSNLVLAGMHVEVSPTPTNPVKIDLSSQFSTYCKVTESPSIPRDTVSTTTLTPHDSDALRAPQKSGLTIKIPGLVDRLALRLLGSCSVTEQTEDEEGLDDSSPDGYAPSESSSESDIEDNYHPAFRPSSSSPDRTSRRKLRRGAASPYHRAGGKLKRKELWVDADTPAGSEVPDFLLGSPTTGRLRTRPPRSGRLY